jgi:hypothetical protein
MITTTKQKIRKAVMEALEKHQVTDNGIHDGDVFEHNFPSVADLVAETLGGEG